MGGSLAGEAALFLCEAILAMCINTTANFEHNYWAPRIRSLTKWLHGMCWWLNRWLLLRRGFYNPSGADIAQTLHIQAGPGSLLRPTKIGVQDLTVGCWVFVSKCNMTKLRSASSDILSTCSADILRPSSELTRLRFCFHPE